MTSLLLASESTPHCHPKVVLQHPDTSDQCDVPEYKVYHRLKEEGGISGWGTSQQRHGQILAEEGILMQQYTANKHLKLKSDCRNEQLSNSDTS